MQSAEEQRGRITRPRHRLREEEHAALAVLDDWELLVTYAVKNGLVCVHLILPVLFILTSKDNPPNPPPLHGQTPRPRR